MKATSGNVANDTVTTAGKPAVAPVPGLAGGSITFTYAAVAGVLIANQQLQKVFPMPLQASAPGVAIAVACAALGAGATNNVVNAYGYQDGG
jgi:hypothetical protein